MRLKFDWLKCQELFLLLYIQKLKRMEDYQSFCKMLWMFTIIGNCWICLKCLKKCSDTKSLYLSIVVRERWITCMITRRYKLFKKLRGWGPKSGFSGLTHLAGYHKQTHIFIRCVHNLMWTFPALYLQSFLPIGYCNFNLIILSSYR